MDKIRAHPPVLHSIPSIGKQESFFQKVFLIIADLWFWLFNKGPAMPPVQATPPPSPTLTKTEKLIQKALREDPSEYMHFNQALKTIAEEKYFDCEEEEYFDCEEEDINPETSLASSTEQITLSNSGTESPPPTPSAERSVTPPPIFESPTAATQAKVKFSEILNTVLDGVTDKEKNCIKERLIAGLSDLLQLDKTVNFEHKQEGDKHTLTLDYGKIVHGQLSKLPLAWFNGTQVEMGPKITLTINIKDRSMEIEPKGAPHIHLMGGTKLTKIQYYPLYEGWFSNKENAIIITTDSKRANAAIGTPSAQSTLKHLENQIISFS